MPTSPQICLIALGANLPRHGCSLSQTLQAAMSRLGELTGVQVSMSRLYRTPCFPAGAGPDYVNAAARLDYPGEASDLLDLLHGIEAEFGRERVQRWGQRTLDLDLIACGDTVLPDAATQTRWRELAPDAQIATTPDQLILPHPRMQDRAFVLVPLADVAACWMHPVLGLSVAQMLARLPLDERDAVIPLDEA